MELPIKTKNPFNSEIINGWLRFLQVSPATVKAYAKALKNLNRFLSANNIMYPRFENLLDFREELISKNSPATVNLYIVAVRKFFTYLSQSGLYENIAAGLKGKSVPHGHKKDALNQKDNLRVFETFSATNLKGKRDKAIYALMVSAGLRTIEISRADICDIVQIYGRFFLQVQGKGRSDKTERVAISPKVYELIEDYLTKRGNCSEDSPLFASLTRRHVEKRLTTDSISKIIKNAFRTAGLDSPRLTAHSLRHTAATQMLLSGKVTLQQVQQVLRHTNINTTMIYAHDLDRLKNYAEDYAAEILFEKV